MMMNAGCAKTNQNTFQQIKDNYVNTTGGKPEDQT